VTIGGSTRNCGKKGHGRKVGKRLRTQKKKNQKTWHRPPKNIARSRTTPEEKEEIV